jgi:hypothetical protein
VFINIIEECPSVVADHKIFVNIFFLRDEPHIKMLLSYLSTVLSWYK